MMAERRNRYQRWLLLLQVFCFPVVCLGQPSSSYPPSIHLNAGIFHAPPYAFDFEYEEEGSRLVASGFSIDLLESIRVFAAEDGVDLTYELREAPPSYNGALELIANDCNTTTNPHTREACQLFDVLIMDYYHTTERAMRIEYTPPWLQGAISAVRHVPEDDGSGAEEPATLAVDASGGTTQSASNDFITLSQASSEGRAVCLVANTSIVPVTVNRFPGAEYVTCKVADECYGYLKKGTCRLFVDDRLQIQHRAKDDASLIVNLETFDPQFVTWVMNELTLAPMERRLMKRWMIAAHQNGTTTSLYEKYFEKQACPIGTAGPDCTLPCSSAHGAANSKGHCVCKSPKWTGPDCTTEVPEELNLIPEPLKILAYCMVGLNGLVIVACALWLQQNRDDKQVHMSQPSFLLMVLLGCLISTSTIVPMAYEPSTPGDDGVVACMAVPWLYSVGFCVTFGTLFAKIRRVYIIFKSSADCKRINVSFLETLAVIGLVLLVDVIILLVWTFVDPLRWQRVVVSEDQFGEPLESEGYCTSEHWVTFGGMIAGLHLFLLLVASCLCFASRHIPPKFSVAKHVSVAIISNLQILVVGIPVLIVVGSQPATSFFLRSVVIWMNDLVVVGLIFGGLIRGVRTGHEATNEEILAAIQDFTKHQSDDQLMDISLHSAMTAIAELPRTALEKGQTGLSGIKNMELHNPLPKLQSGLSGIANIELPNPLPAFRLSNCSDLSTSLRTRNVSWKGISSSERTTSSTHEMNNSSTDHSVDMNDNSTTTTTTGKTGVLQENTTGNNFTTTATTRKSGFPREDFLDKDSWAVSNLDKSTILDPIEQESHPEGSGPFQDESNV